MHGSDGGQKCHLNNSSEQGKILTVTATGSMGAAKQ
jgi:hypothetical protein